MNEELDHPSKDFEIRPHEKIIITLEERRELREVLLPYFKGKTLGNYILEMADTDIKEKVFSVTSSCSHLPVIADLSLDKDLGHQMANYEKVLHNGLTGIKQEVETYMAQLNRPYMHYEIQEKRDFYKAVIITLDAAMAYAKQYADLARDMAVKENNLKRKHELERISKVCDKVPAYPARDWWEALQSVWMIHVLIHCDVYNIANSLGRFDQYMYYFYNKSVNEEKTLTREEALELLECFWVKVNEWAIVKTTSNSRCPLIRKWLSGRSFNR